MKSFKDYFRENLGASILEPIDIKGLGTVHARVISHNQHNEIHGTDIKKTNNTISFLSEYGDRITAPCADDLTKLPVSIQGKKHCILYFIVKDKKDDVEKCILNVMHLKPIVVDQ